jgi:signal transduction histidine kinase
VLSYAPAQTWRARLADTLSGGRWLAVVAMVICAILTVTALSSNSRPLPAAMLLAVAVYFVASRLPRWLSVTAVAAAAAAVGAVLLSSELTMVRPPVTVEAVEGFLPLLAAWFVGDAVAARRRYLAGLAEQAERERAAEAERARQDLREERVRIARELHDVVAHALTVVTVQAGVGRRLMARRPEEASMALETIESVGRTAQEELRVVLGLLREEGIGAADLAPAPRLGDLKELAETVRAAGTSVDVRIEGTEASLSPALQLSIYRVVQEALTNVVKHAPGAAATVAVRISDADVRVEISDRGASRGDDPANPPSPPTPPTHPRPGAPTGQGLVGMRERVGAFGGSLVAGARRGGGFRVLAEIPVEGARDD